MIPAFKSILDLQKAFPNEQACIDHLERLSWGGNPVSPFDPTSKVYKCKDNKYKCKNTGKYFNVRTGSIFDNTKIKLEKWFLALYVFSSHKKGISSHQLAKDIDVTQKTAWFLLHRLRYAFDHPNFQKPLGNTIEMDETYIGGKHKNKSRSVRLAAKASTGQKGKAPVFGMLERDGNLFVQAFNEQLNGSILKPIIREKASKDSTLITDSFGGYKGLGMEFKQHEVICHGANEFSRDGFHTNSIEGFFSQLKRGIYGVYHWVSPKHLGQYCQEFTLRYNTRDFNVQGRFDMILSAIAGKRLTYQTLVHGK